MTELLKIIDEIDQTFKREKEKLFKLKIFAFLLGLAAVAYSYFKIYNSKLRFQYTFLEINAIELAVALIVLMPIVLTPLYKFFSDKTYERFNWEVKNAIFKDIFDKYNIEYRIGLKQKLPDADIKNLNLEDKLFTFCYGDDLIWGEFNDTAFRISEVHSGSIFKNKFDGLAGVLTFSDENLARKYYSQIYFSGNKFILEPIGNSIYFKQTGFENYFEFSFKRGTINRDKLTDDYHFLKAFVDQMFVKLV